MVVKNLPIMRETLVPSLGQEDPLEKGMATHSSICAWRIPWTEEPGGLQELDTTERLKRARAHTHVWTEFRVPSWILVSFTVDLLELRSK